MCQLQTFALALRRASSSGFAALIQYSAGNDTYRNAPASITRDDRAAPVELVVHAELDGFDPLRDVDPDRSVRHRGAAAGECCARPGHELLVAEVIMVVLDKGRPAGRKRPFRAAAYRPAGARLVAGGAGRGDTKGGRLIEIVDVMRPGGAALHVQERLRDPSGNAEPGRLHWQASRS